MAIVAEITENKCIKERHLPVIWQMLHGNWKTLRDRCQLVLFTNSKWHTVIQLIPKSVTLNRVMTTNACTSASAELAAIYCDVLC